jgi:AraC-like DNA-binding protein
MKLVKRVKPMISVAAMTGLLEAIRDAGADPDQVLRTFELEPSVLADVDGFIPCSVFARILEEAARATGDDCFGLHFGERFNPKNIGQLAYAVLNSPTVGEADAQVARYIKLYNQAAQASVIIEGQRAYMRYVLSGLDIPTARQQNEYGMAVRLNTIRMMVGSQWAPLEVQFAHEAPADISEHQRIFSGPVLFDYPTNNFVVEREFLERQVPAADTRLFGIMKRFLELVLEEMPPEDVLITAVRRAVAESVRNGEPSLRRMAKRMAMSPRTLQRHLKERGTDFKNLVDDTRRRFALTYLKDRRNAFTEIAFLLGYSDASAFNRAFKRWTGLAPSAYRAQAASGISPAADASDQ